jgi:hypothetical protein
MAFRYKTTPEMAIVRIKDNKEFQLSEIKLGNYGGTNTVLHLDGKTISRSTIDETAFSLGPPPVYKGKKVKQAKRTTPQTPPSSEPERTVAIVKQQQFVSISKDELVNIHQALQAAADATQRLLVRLILQG